MRFNVDPQLSGTALESYAVNQLMAGPPVAGDTLVLFPPGTHAGVTQLGSIVTVNLRGPITRSFQSGSTDEAGMFKSLTYTLTGLPGVTAVQILVDGKKLAALPGGAFELDEPLNRNTFSE